jgi:hypothetical protein
MRLTVTQSGRGLGGTGILEDLFPLQLDGAVRGSGEHAHVRLRIDVGGPYWAPLYYTDDLVSLDRMSGSMVSGTDTVHVTLRR